MDNEGQTTEKGAERGEKRHWREKKKQMKEWKKEKKERQMAQKEESASADKLLEEQQQRERLESGRNWTVSIALPGSILNNAQSPELRTYLGGQIARAAAVFCVDEIVIYDEYSSLWREGKDGEGEDGTGVEEGEDEGRRKQCLVQLAKILEYLECPQYLRKYLFPLQKNLQFAGLLNPLDCRHHLRADDLSLPFREGVVTKRPVKEGSSGSTSGSHVNVGLLKEAKIDKALKPGVRVTVELNLEQLQSEEGQNKWKGKLKGKAVAPSLPRTRLGLYWGYSVRVAHSLSQVLAESSFDETYDLMIGTSERGDDVDRVIDALPGDFKHCIIVFGGLKGIEAALDSDTKLSQIQDPRDLFNYYLNTCPNQGSNTIRTEEALLITLSALRPKLVRNKCPAL